MADEQTRGCRLLASVIESYAINDAGTVWASIPKDDDDLSKGFVDLTYKEFGNAINHAAWWLKEHLHEDSTRFETLAYTGPKDLRYPILAVAVLKMGKQLLLPSPFATEIAQTHLLSVTQCRTYLYATTMKHLVDQVSATKSNLRALAVPELTEWLKVEEARPFPYTRTWAEAKSDPWLIFHTSGTIGLPKPITYTNFMMTSFDAAETMSDADQETTSTHFANSRWYTPLPTLHFVGMAMALQSTAFLNTVLVTGPAGPATARIFVVIPLALRVCEDSSMYTSPARLCPRPQQLSDHVKIQSAMGTTEAGAYFLQIRDDNDWNYYSFRPAMGVELERRTEELYELVFYRRPELERWQQLFHVYPDLDRFATNDLFAKHPSKSNLWRYVGRTDDMIVLSHGEDLYASGMEAEIEKCPDIKVALVGGDRRPRPCLIVELLNVAVSGSREKEAWLDRIWPVVEKTNELCSDYVRLSRDLIAFTDPRKPLVQTAKGTISRRQSLALYEKEIDDLYRSWGGEQ